MAVAGTRITIRDGGLGSRRSFDRPPAVLGCSSGGTANSPLLVSSTEDAVTAFGYGELTELIGRYLQFGGPVLAVKAATVTAGASGSVDDAGDAGSTAAMTVTTATARDTYAVRIRVTRAGANLAALTAAVRVSYDGGVTEGEELAVPSSGVLALGNTGLAVTWADGTFVAGGYWTFATTAPAWDATTLAAALDALEVTVHDHEFVHVAGACNRAAAQAVKDSLASLYAAGVYRRALVSARDQALSGETVSAWLTAISGASPGFAGFDGAHYLDVCAGAATEVESVVVRPASLRRSVAWVVGPWLAYLRTNRREGFVGLAEHPGRVDLGPIPGVAFGELLHDARVYPAIDSARFMALQSHVGRRDGYFCTQRSMAMDGSDFAVTQNARVIVEAATQGMAILTKRIGLYLRRAAGSGIEESDAAALDTAMTTELVGQMAGLCTTAKVTVDRASTAGLLRGSIRVRPYDYANEIEFGVGMTRS